LMSVYNLAGILSHESGALLTHWLGVTDTHFENLWLLVLMTNLATLLPLPMLRWVPDSASQDQEGEAMLKPDFSLSSEVLLAEAEREAHVRLVSDTSP
jgi:BT1 family